MPLKGVGGEGKPIVGKPSTNNHIKCKLFPIGVDTAKENGLLSPEDKGSRGWVLSFSKQLHRRIFQDVDSREGCQEIPQRFSPQRVGKIRPRNEALDCRVYALAALSIVGVNVNIIAQRSMAGKSSDQNETKAVEKTRRKMPRRDGGFVERMALMAMKSKTRRASYQKQDTQKRPTR